MKTLYFEGAGCVERGEVENCRIRTAFYNDAGMPVYLEIIGFEPNKWTKKAYKKLGSPLGNIDFCHWLTDGDDDCNESRVIGIYGNTLERTRYIPYTKQGILDFVNKNLDCSFEQVVILDAFDGYRVFKDTYDNDAIGYRRHHNIMQEWAETYSKERADAARKKYNELEKQIEEEFNSKYSVCSYTGRDEKYIHIRFHCTDEKLREHGRNFRNYRFKY